VSLHLAGTVSVKGADGKPVAVPVESVNPTPGEDIRYTITAANGVLAAFDIVADGTTSPRWTREQHHSFHPILYPDTGELVTNAVNIPAIRAEDMELLGPYVPLAATLGRLAMEIAGGRAGDTEDRESRKRLRLPRRQTRRQLEPGAHARRPRPRLARGPPASSPTTASCNAVSATRWVNGPVETRATPSSCSSRTGRDRPGALMRLSFRGPSPSTSAAISSARASNSLRTAANSAARRSWSRLRSLGPRAA